MLERSRCSFVGLGRERSAALVGPHVTKRVPHLPPPGFLGKQLKRHVVVVASRRKRQTGLGTLGGRECMLGGGLGLIRASIVVGESLMGVRLRQRVTSG